MVELGCAVVGENSDLFDSIICAEERFEGDGFLIGMKDGRERGIKTGSQKGQLLGKQIGEEMGFYQGFVLTWKKLLQSKETNTRKMKALQLLVTMLEGLDIANPSAEDYMKKLNQVRSKFKQVTSLLGVQVQYEKSDAQPSYSF